jgi:hypothetical protein
MKHRTMMYFFPIASIFCVLLSSNLYSHGFADKTKMRGMYCCYVSLKRLCEEIATGEEKFVQSYDWQKESSGIFRKILKGYESRETTGEYMRLSCSYDYTENSPDDIICSLFQEFYNLETKQWVPAYTLNKGDLILAACGPIKVSFAKRITHGKQIHLYMIEVEDTHLFYIGNANVLTHNILLPVVIKVGLDIAFGAGTVAGAAVGSFFGPLVVTICAGVGGILGIITAAICGRQVPKFNIEYSIPGHRDTLYEHDIQADNAQQFNITPLSHEQPTGCFHPVPHKQPIGCGSAEPVKPITHITLPIPQLEKENVGCRTLPEETKNRENTIICDDNARVEKIAKDLITVAAEHDAQAPGKPTEVDDYVPPKNWGKNEVKSPSESEHALPDKQREERSTSELIREVRSLTKRANEHKNKLDEYIKDPDMYDHKGFLKNATAERRSEIINGRVGHLTNEIETFQETIKKTMQELASREIQGV